MGLGGEIQTALGYKKFVSQLIFRPIESTFVVLVGVGHREKGRDGIYHGLPLLPMNC